MRTLGMALVVFAVIGLIPIQAASAAPKLLFAGSFDKTFELKITQLKSAAGDKRTESAIRAGIFLSGSCQASCQISALAREEAIQASVLQMNCHSSGFPALENEAILIFPDNP